MAILTTDHADGIDFISCFSFKIPDKSDSDIGCAQKLKSFVCKSIGIVLVGISLTIGNIKYNKREKPNFEEL
eukprot:m.118874 g.118874  ORF g.118874 m.118874 type:complete len:72 (+) comp14294_c1_seq1:3475-3690(+)